MIDDKEETNVLRVLGHTASRLRNPSETHPQERLLKDQWVNKVVGVTGLVGLAYFQPEEDRPFLDALEPLLNNPPADTSISDKNKESKYAELRKVYYGEFFTNKIRGPKNIPEPPETVINTLQDLVHLTYWIEKDQDTFKAFVCEILKTHPNYENLAREQESLLDLIFGNDALIKYFNRFVEQCVNAYYIRASQVEQVQEKFDPVKALVVFWVFVALGIISGPFIFLGASTLAASLIGGMFLGAIIGGLVDLSWLLVVSDLVRDQQMKSFNSFQNDVEKFQSDFNQEQTRIVDNFRNNPGSHLSAFFRPQPTPPGETPKKPDNLVDHIANGFDNVLNPTIRLAGPSLSA